jgi:YegS/Rv2252/BmrU family lipid kinase
MLLPGIWILPRVRTCVIFNPTAKGDKAKRFRKHLDQVGAECTLKLTAAAGDARRLAAEAVAEGFEIVAAAGGDGTVNEVLNGLAEAPQGLERARLAVLPLGTVNVFARELGIPASFEPAWAALRQGRETSVDLPLVEYDGKGQKVRRYFAQLAGAGLDARAIELVHYPLKKKIGPLAYVVAGLNAMREKPTTIQATGGGYVEAGELVLIGNGRLYGGQFAIFPEADLRDGLLEVCVLPKVNWFTLARCGPQLVLQGTLPPASMRIFRAPTVTLTSDAKTPLEVDGELIGHLPASFSVMQSRLRVIVPG